MQRWWTVVLVAVLMVGCGAARTGGGNDDDENNAAEAACAGSCEQRCGRRAECAAMVEIVGCDDACRELADTFCMETCLRDPPTSEELICTREWDFVPNGPEPDLGACVDLYSCADQGATPICEAETDALATVDVNFVHEANRVPSVTFFVTGLLAAEVDPGEAVTVPLRPMAYTVSIRETGTNETLASIEADLTTPSTVRLVGGVGELALVVE